MGNQVGANKELDERRKQIETYWKDSKKGKTLRVSQDNRIIKRFFTSYDKGNKGYLDKNEAVEYIQDLLKISGYDKEISNQAKKTQTDSKGYYDDYVLSIFHEMDPKMSGTITFEQLIKPKFQQWNDFLQTISSKGAREREFTRRLREKEEASKSPKPARKAGDADDDDIVEEPEVYEEDYEEEEQMSAKKLREKLEKDALSASGIHDLRDQQISEVAEILEVELHVAQALLAHFKWDKDKLLSDYCNDPAKVFESIKMELPSEPASAKKRDTVMIEKPESIECSICFDDVDAPDFTGLDECQHYFCNGCWKMNLEDVQIKEGRTIDITCMHQGCNNLVPARIVKQLVSNDAYAKYARFSAKTFVDSHADLKWCPAPGCERAVNNFRREGKTLVGTCACGLKFCLHCMEEAHPTISCKVLKDWNLYLSGNLDGASLPQTKAAADIMTLQWIAENTKDCPKCGTTVEKNQGCFQMTCRTCHSQWCWRCLEDWSTHSDHFRCTKYDETEVKDKPAFSNEELEKRKAKFKVAHFFNQFKDHDQSLKLEKQNREKVEALIKKLKADMESVNGEYLEEAVVQLQECRLGLKYSYVYLFFQDDDLLKARYEMLQENLEMITEKLTQSIDKQHDQISGPEIRKLTAVANTALKNLLTFEEITNQEFQVLGTCPKPLFYPRCIEFTTIFT